MKNTTIRLGLFALSLSLLGSCGVSFDQVEKKAKSMSSILQTELTDIRTSLHELSQTAESGFKSSKMLDLDLNSLVKNGTLGLFKSPQGSILYSNEKAGASFYLSPGEGQNPNIERASRILLALAPHVTGAFAGHKDYLTVFFVGLHLPESLAIFAPYVNTSALYPPNLDFSQFEWFKRGQASANGGAWATEPFTDLSTGWVEDVAESFNTGMSERGVAIASVNIRLLAARLDKLDPAGTFLLLSPNHTVIVAGKNTKTLIGVPDLGNYDFTAQTSTNYYATDEYKLGGPSQSDQVKKLEAQLQSGTKSFALDLGGKTLKVSQEKITELNWTLVALD